MPLDLGAHGIIVPQVNTAEQAATVVRWARYAPEGARGVGLARAHGYRTTFREYMSSANREITVIVQAEHARAVENIVRLAGIDTVRVGPYDLSASLGGMGQVSCLANCARNNSTARLRQRTDRRRALLPWKNQRRCASRRSNHG